MPTCTGSRIASSVGMTFRKRLGVQGSAQLALRHRANATPDPLGGERSAAIADPERVAGDRNRRTAYQLWPVMGEVLFDPASEVVG
jgi:hypothetical protein